MSRIALAFVPFIINCIACMVFLLVRPPASSLIEDRESAQAVGALSLSSADPYMLIAERPLRQWNTWHGGESTWVKIIEVLNGPAVIAAKHFGDEWAGNHAFSGIPTYRRESWVRAYVFVIASSLQWLLVGMLISRLTR